MNILFIGNSWSRDAFKNAINESDNRCFLSSPKEGSLDQWCNVIGSFDWVVIDRRSVIDGKDTDQSPISRDLVQDEENTEVIRRSEMLFNDIEKGIILSYSGPVKRRA